MQPQLEAIDYTKRVCIVAAEIEEQTGIFMIGIVIDSVSEVLNISDKDVDERPTFGPRLNTDYWYVQEGRRCKGSFEHQ